MTNKELYEMFENLSDDEKLKLLNNLEHEKIAISETWNINKVRAEIETAKQLTPYQLVLFRHMQVTGEI